MNELIAKLEELRERVSKARARMHTQEKQKEIAALKRAMEASDFWSDQKRAQQQSQQLSALQTEIATFEKIEKELSDLIDLAKMDTAEDAVDLRKDIETHYAAYLKEFEQFELTLLMSGTYDERNAIISIHAGTGGVDAMDFAAMLLRMVVRFAEKRGWHVAMMHETRGDEAGIKSAVLMVKGRCAYGYLKSEHGVHRLVRISPFDAEGMRHTSFALIEVMPELDDVGEIDIDPKELRIDTFLASGKGGQNVQKNETAVSITHLPTGIAVACQSERSQLQNKETAMKLLVGKLTQLKYNERKEEAAKIRGEYQEAAWGNQIRSYVLHPYHQVKDHRTGIERKDPEAVLDGDIMDFVEGYLRGEKK